MKQDRISGAVEIEKKIISRIERFLENEKLFDECFSIISKYPSMGSIWNISNFAFLMGGDAIHEYHKMEEANKKVVENGKKFIKDGYTIVTYSRSSTVKDILKKCKDKKISVVCSEARPKYEGRRLVKELCNHVEITMVVDSGIFSFIEEADAVIVGADAILERSILNKTGTSAIAIYAKQIGVPFCVACSSYKSFPFAFIKEEGKEEIWKNPPENAKIKNFYFDKTPLEYISYFISERGISREAIKFNYELSEGIKRIKNILQSKYHFVK